MEKERGIKITNVDEKKQCDIHVVSNQRGLLDCPCCKSSNTSNNHLDGVRTCLDCDTDWAI
jgi:hypothetical protein